MSIFKKIIFLFLIFTIFNNIFTIDSSLANSLSKSNTTKFSNNLEKIETNSKNIIVLDRKTLSILYEKSPFQKVPMASTTKIMTCIIAIEKSKLDDIITVSKNASKVQGSTLGLKENMKISMNDLLYGLMLKSGNDCAIAIAEYLSESVESFADLMNKKAKELNLLNTHFVSPHGLDDQNHYTSAYDLAILTNYALNNEIFKKIVSTKTHTIYLNNSPKEISNTNELLGNLTGVYGVKTGFTFGAGRCLVSACKREALDIIVVVLGADTKKIRTQDSFNLINYIFKNYKYINLENTIKTEFNNYLKYLNNFIILEKTKTIPKLKLKKLKNYDFPLNINITNNFQSKLYLINKFSSDISKDSKVGTMQLYCNNKLLYSIDIILDNNLIKNSWNYYFCDILKIFK